MKGIECWKWKNTIIDFDNIDDEKSDWGYYTKAEMVFQYLGIPDDEVHTWYSGGFSCEYNTALRYAKELGLVEDYIDYEDEIYTLKHNWNELKKYIEDRISVLTVSIDNKTKDQYFNDKCIGGVQELKHIRYLLKELEEGGNNENN